MATTTGFNTGLNGAGALYPGGAGGTKIVFADPYPAGLPTGDGYSDYYLHTIPLDATTTAYFLGCIWNIKEWSVKLDSKINLTTVLIEESGTYEGTYVSELKTEGKASYFEIYFSYTGDEGDAEYYYGKRVYIDEPKNLVCGKSEKTDGTQVGMPTVTTQNYSSTLLPYVGARLNLSSNSLDTTYTVSGMSIYAKTSGQTGYICGAAHGFLIEKIWVKTDGTSVVYARIGVEVTDIGAFTAAKLVNSDNIPNEPDQFIAMAQVLNLGASIGTLVYVPVTVKFIGVEFPAYVLMGANYYENLDSMTLDAFKCEYSLTVSERWDY
jgi:hypothetical protein